VPWLCMLVRFIRAWRNEGVALSVANCLGRVTVVDRIPWMNMVPLEARSNFQARPSMAAFCFGGSDVDGALGCQGSNSCLSLGSKTDSRTPPQQKHMSTILGASAVCHVLAGDGRLVR
jgi:hypothetical protein